MFLETNQIPNVPTDLDSEPTTRVPRSYKTGLASDLHMDFELMNPEFFDWRGDLLLLPGDLAEEDFLRQEECRPFWEQVNEMAPVVLFNLGNHEFYRSEIDRAIDHMREFLAPYKNITLLENEVYKLDGLQVFGATYWTNFGDNPVAEFGASMVLNDYKKIRYAAGGFRKIKPIETKAMNLGSRELLKKTLANGEPTLVMTHHAPSMMSSHPKYADDYEMNLCYCNRDEALILDNPQILAWVHGHTHWRWDYELWNTRILCNARGYPGERPDHLPPYRPLEFVLVPR